MHMNQTWRSCNLPTLYTGALWNGSLWPGYTNRFQGSSNTFHQRSQNDADPMTGKSHPCPDHGWELTHKNDKNLLYKKNYCGGTIELWD